MEPQTEMKTIIPIPQSTAFIMYPTSPAITILFFTLVHPTRPMTVRIKKAISMIMFHQTAPFLKIEMSATVSKMSEIENQVILATLY